MRKDFKGQTKTDEHLRLLCQIRHECTNYEKLMVFYNMYPNKRSELNKAIDQLIKVGPEGIEHFRQKVKHIEDYVNLNRKKSQKRFLKEQSLRIKEQYPNYSNCIVKKCAETMLSQYIRENNEQIIYIKGVQNDDTRLN